MWRHFSASLRRLLLLSGLACIVCAPALAEGSVHALTLVQFNDVYEIFPLTVAEQGHTVQRSGMAYIATMLKHQRAAGPTLVLHAGDMISPSLASIKLKHKGAQMIAALNAIGVDLATFGNHEFDFGCKVLAERVRESRFPWVSANVDLPAALGLPPDKVMPYRVLETAGLRLGVFGLTVPIQPIEEGCEGAAITFRDPISAAREVLPRLKQEKIDIIIALTHLRMDQDQALAQALPEIDFIVGGHDHDAVVDLAGKTLITKAGANATALGLIGIEAAQADGRWVVEKSWRREPVDPARVEADPEVSKLLAPYAEEMKPFQKVIGSTAVPLDAQEDTVRQRESNFGDWLADVARAAMHTEVALINGGSVRDDRVVPPGPLTLADLYTLLPFDNRLVAVRVTGAQLLAALENGVSLVGQKAGRFPEVSGMRFRYDPSRPMGKRILGVWVGGKPLRSDRVYSLATTDFVVERGEIDGYTMLPKTPLRRGGEFNQVVIRALASGNPLRPRLEGRIVREVSGAQPEQ